MKNTSIAVAMRKAFAGKQVSMVAESLKRQGFRIDHNSRVRAK